MSWLFGFNTGRGHRRARIFDPTGPRSNELGPVRIAAILSFR